MLVRAILWIFDPGRRNAATVVRHDIRPLDIMLADPPDAAASTRPETVGSTCLDACVGRYTALFLISYRLIASYPCLPSNENRQDQSAAARHADGCERICTSTSGSSMSHARRWAQNRKPKPSMPHSMQSPSARSWLTASAGYGSPGGSRIFTGIETSDREPWAHDDA